MDFLVQQATTITGAVTIIALLAAFWWFLPRWLVSKSALKSPGARQRYEDGKRSSITQALGGLSVIVGILVTLYQMQRTELQTAATKSLDVFQRSSEMLANKDIKAHSGPAITMIEIASTQKIFQPSTLIQLILALHTDASIKSQSASGCMPNHDNPTEPDVRVLASRLASRPFLQNQDFMMDLAFLNLRGIRTARGWFNHADFGYSDLSGSDFYGARLYQTNFRHANLNGVSMSGAELSHSSFNEASLCRGKNFAVPALGDGDHLLEPNSSDSSAQLVSTALFETEMRGAHLDYADLSGAESTKSHFEKAYFDNAKFCQTEFDDAHFDGASFKNAEGDAKTKFTNSSLIGAKFEGATFRGTDFSGSHLDGAHFDHADLSNSVLNGASLKGASFEGAILCGAKTDDANLEPKTSCAVLESQVNTCKDFEYQPPPWKDEAFKFPKQTG